MVKARVKTRNQLFNSGFKDCEGSIRNSELTGRRCAIASTMYHLLGKDGEFEKMDDNIYQGLGYYWNREELIFESTTKDEESTVE